jgi:hypothetical protein
MAHNIQAPQIKEWKDGKDGRGGKDGFKKLASLLNNFADSENSLEIQLDSTLKHVQSYLKVIKSHMPLLQDILKTEAHYYRNLESIKLPAPLLKLLQILDNIDGKDLQMLEELSTLAARWQEVTQSAEAGVTADMQQSKVV